MGGWLGCRVAVVAGGDGVGTGWCDVALVCQHWGVRVHVVRLVPRWHLVVRFSTQARGE